jgi:monofunctional biosynthetic peptidoglycan transglycosylase
MLNAAITAALLVAALVAGVVAFRIANPGITPVTVAKKLTGKGVVKKWVPLAKMSTDLPVAVIASEDGRFCNHWGVDWPGVKDAIMEERSIRGVRGASTIPMQLAKNLFLWAERDYLRKAIEIPLAYLLTALWPKPVIIESYLNIAPWGPGTFGAEEASRHYFHKSADELSREEAILLAISLPSPILRNPAKPTPKMLRLTRIIDERMRSLSTRYSCVSP